MLTDNENRGKEKQTVSQGPVEPAPLPAELAGAGVAVQYAIFATGCYGRKACEKGLFESLVAHCLEMALRVHFTQLL